MKQKKHTKACHFEAAFKAIHPHRNNIQPIEIVELEDNSFHLITAIEINGICGEVIIDTGASVTVIDKKLIQEAETPESNIEMMSGGVNGEINDVRIIKTKQFKIGNTKIKGMQVAAINLDYVNEMYARHLNRKIIGLLGCDFCVKYQVLIDYQNKTLSWRK